jgi:hypothetical protein
MPAKQQNRNLFDSINLEFELNEAKQMGINLSKKTPGCRGRPPGATSHNPTIGVRGVGRVRSDIIV